MSAGTWPQEPSPPAVWTLPSGRRVEVHEVQEEGCDPVDVVDLSGGLVLVVDRIPFEPDRVEAGLFWPSSRLELDRDGRPQVPSDEQGACVVAGCEGLEITRGVYQEGEECPCCADSDVCDTAFRVWLPVAEVHLVVDVLAGLPRRFDAVRVGEGGVLVWRGRRSQDGSAVIERAVLRGPPRMPGGRYDGRDTDRSFDVVSTVAVGLPAPPPDLAVPIG